MILECLAGKKLIVYGTGHVAHKFYKALYQHNLQKNIWCFVKTADVCEGETFEGIRVYRFEHIRYILSEKDMLVCLAVHESLRDEIEENVKRVTQQYLWIYPYLYELMFGEAGQKEAKLDIRLLLNGYRKDLRLGVRMAAIEQQEGKNTYGFDYYVRAQMLHCSRDTAAQRLKQFVELMQRWELSGYEKSYLICVNHNYEVIDGNHRVAMAVYAGQDVIYGNVYPTELTPDMIHGEEAMLTEDVLVKHGFTACEIERLKKVQQRYVRRYE